MINAAPNANYEAWCEAQPRGPEWDGVSYNAVYLLDGRIVQQLFFTRYHGEYDVSDYGDIVTDAWVMADDFRAAHFMA